MPVNNQDISLKNALGLPKDPFPPEPDPLFYFSFDAFEQRLKMLHGLVQGADILVLVIGQPGSGKTTLLNRLLASAGYAGYNPFNGSMLTEIHQTSGGYPGPVNGIAQQWLNERYSTKKKGRPMLQHFSAPPRRVAVWMVAGAIIILLAALWLFQNRKQPGSARPDQKIAKKVFRQKIPQDQQLAEEIIRPKGAKNQTPAPAPKKIKMQPPAKVKTAAITPTAIENRQQALTEKASLEPATGAAAESNQTEQKSAAPVTAAPPPDAAPAVVGGKPEPPGASTDAGAEDLKPQQISDARIAPASAPQRPEAAVEEPKEEERAVHRENWLLSQDAAYFTIQIMGVHNEELLLDFIEKNQFLQQNKIAYYESTFEDKQWYQLLYGMFPTRPEAESAVDQLPENIRRTGPWIRRLSTIQKVIRERGLQ